MLDPKCDWALRNLQHFPVEINKADYNTLLKVPGIGVISAKRIITARREFNLTFENLKKLGIVLKRARYFITCNGKYYDPIKHFNENFIAQNLLFLERTATSSLNYVQTSLFDNISNADNFIFDALSPTKEDKQKCLTGIL